MAPIFDAFQPSKMAVHPCTTLRMEKQGFSTRSQYIVDRPEVNIVQRFVFTMIWFLTRMTPSVSLAICTARSRAGKLPTVPLRVTLPSTVLMPMAYLLSVESANLRAASLIRRYAAVAGRRVAQQQRCAAWQHQHQDCSN
jgi:hypothetical protein